MSQNGRDGSGRWKPGSSGNPRGRTSGAEAAQRRFRELAKSTGDDPARLLWDTAFGRSDLTAWRARIDALTLILAYLWGRPRLEIAIAEEPTDDGQIQGELLGRALSSLSPTELSALARIGGRIFLPATMTDRPTMTVPELRALNSALSHDELRALAKLDTDTDGDDPDVH